MNPDIVTNDIIKLVNSKFFFIGCSKDNDKIYISIFLMYSIRVLVNCYTIYLYNDNNFKIYRYVQSILFNLNIVEFVCNKTNINNYDDIIFNISQNIMTENNIFNFVLSKILFINIPNSDLIKIFLYIITQLSK